MKLLDKIRGSHNPIGIFRHKPCWHMISREREWPRKLTGSHGAYIPKIEEMGRRPQADIEFIDRCCICGSEKENEGYSL